MTLSELRSKLERWAVEAERLEVMAPLGRVYRVLLEDIAQVEGLGTAGNSESDSSSDEPMLTVREAAKLLNVSPRWLYRRAGKLPFMRRLQSSKLLRVSRTALLNYMAARSRWS